MKTLYLVVGFDCRDRAAGIFYPDPFLFETEDEAMRYCGYHSDGKIVYGYQRVRVGKFTMRGKK